MARVITKDGFALDTDTILQTYESLRTYPCRSSEATTYDPVSRPSHYCEGRRYEPADVAEDWGLDKDAYLFNAFKYIARAGRKEDKKLDLEKAVWYLQRRIETMGGEE